MTAPDMNEALLNQLPGAVQEKMDEVGLRATLENLFEHLRDDDVPSDECADLIELLDWTIGVLMAATGPLIHQTFNNLNNNFHQIDHYVAHNDWHSYTGHIPPILQDLATIPTAHPTYSFEATKQVTAALQKARRSIVASEASVRKRREEAELSFAESVESHEEAIAELAEVVSTRLSRLKAVATGRFGRLQEAATDEHETLSAEMSQLLTDLKEAATDEYGTLSEAMSNLLENLQERYGFTAKQVLGGDHERAAIAANSLAESHKKVSRRAMWAAVIWAAMIQAAIVTSLWVSELKELLDADEWVDVLGSVPIVGSPVVILLFIAKREGRIAAEHRERHERLQSLALQFKSWEPYLSTLTTEARNKLEEEITPRLFRGDAKR